MAGNIREYAQVRIAEVRLEVVEKAAGVLAGLVGRMFVVLLFVVCAVFAATAAAFDGLSAYFLIKPCVYFFRFVGTDEPERVFVSVVDLRLFAVEDEGDEFGFLSFAAGEVPHPEGFVDDDLTVDLHRHIAYFLHLTGNEYGGG